MTFGMSPWAKAQFSKSMLGVDVGVDMELN